MTNETVRKLIVPTCLGAFIVPVAALWPLAGMEVAASVGALSWLVAVLLFVREGIKRFR